MSMIQKRRVSLVVVALLGVMMMVGLYVLPTTLTTLSYAVEKGKAYASQEQLSVARDLSAAFKNVAKSMRPAVVSITSVKKAPPLARGQHRMSPQMPDELRRFFGDDFAGRLPFNLPGPSQGHAMHGTGSGVIVSEDGYVLTNNHVVTGADDVTVHLSDNRQFKAKVIGTDKATDLAVLKIDATGLAPATLGDSDSMEVGDWVVAIGSPFGLDQTVTAGIVSAMGRGNVGITDYENFIQTDAAINPGNSGGPLVNLKGEVIGIDTAIASRNGGNMGIGFAIPSNMARTVMDSLIKNGHVQRGYLGAMIQNLDPDMAASFGFHGTDGVLIGDVISDGPAAKAGLKMGDIVTRYDGKKVKNVRQLRQLVAATDPSVRVKVELVREGKPQTLIVQIAPLAGDSPSLAAVKSTETNKLGISAQTLTQDLASQLGYTTTVKGVVVTAVEPGSAAELAGIQPKDVIVAVGNSRIANVADLTQAIKTHSTKKGVRLLVMHDNISRYVFLRIGE